MGFWSPLLSGILFFWALEIALIGGKPILNHITRLALWFLPIAALFAASPSEKAETAIACLIVTGMLFAFKREATIANINATMERFRSSAARRKVYWEKRRP
jgi:hypothetical protein